MADLKKPISFKLPNIKLPKVFQIFSGTGSKIAANEINLVPDVKGEMIRALKLRNLVFFLCIVVASASAGAIVFFASIAGGQQAIVDGKLDTLKVLSAKVKSYGDLDEFLTIKDQLGNLAEIDSRKKLLSRTFGIIATIFPNGVDTADKIEISELNINLTSDAPTFSFDAQADAGEPPYIDYNVLDSFKKSLPYMRYDYGNYVDKNGDTIPAYCIVENDTETGATFYDTSKESYYAYWLITGDGCNPAYTASSDDEDEEDQTTSTGTSSNTSQNTSGQEEKPVTNEEVTTTYDPETGVTTVTTTTTTTTTIITTNSDGESTTTVIDKELAKKTAGYITETYNNQTVVKIWRTPQFNEWYKTEKQLASLNQQNTLQSGTSSTGNTGNTGNNNLTTNSNNLTQNNQTTTTTKSYMTLDGKISGIPHFESQCITYTGTEDEQTGKVTWDYSNDSCKLIEFDENNPLDYGINISDSSNGRGADDQLMLRFSAVISFNPEVFKFSNKHLLPLGPRGRHNVTDSYVQIQSMFGERAADCLPTDTVCNGGSTSSNTSNTTNNNTTGGGN